MEGLEEILPLLRRKNLVKVNHRIYCHPISRSFLIHKHGQQYAKFICPISTDKPTYVNVYDKAAKQDLFYKVRVTAIPANHCPGSVMFLFEHLVDNYTILYTGDFRLENVKLSTLDALHRRDDFRKPIEVDQMYLDTTFCTKQFETFPTRDEAIDNIWHLVSGWIRKNGMYRHQRPRHVILFVLPAQYGSEAILDQVYRKSGTKWKIHVSQAKFKDYLCAQDLKNCTHSEFKEATWIHACSWKDPGVVSKPDYHGRTLPCQDGPFVVRQIKPTALYFTQERLARANDENRPGVHCQGGDLYRVCYSSHSSLSELLAFVKYFQPKSIVPIVIPKDSNEGSVMALLNSVIVHKIEDRLVQDDSMMSLCSPPSPTASSTPKQGEYGLALSPNTLSPISPLPLVVSTAEQVQSTSSPKKTRKRKHLNLIGPQPAASVKAAESVPDPQWAASIH
jgi:hypothetical protein